MRERRQDLFGNCKKKHERENIYNCARGAEEQVKQIKLPRHG